MKERPTLSWKQRNRQASNARRRERYAANPDAHRQRQRDYKRGEAKPHILEANRIWQTAYRRTLRAQMIEAYGSCCKCCGEFQPEFLQLDHVENDGHVDRKVHRTSNKLLAHLKRAGWPQDRSQLLCANCNFGKLMNGGVCPQTRTSHA